MTLVAKWEVDEAMKPFLFEHLSNDIMITGVADTTVKSITVPDYVAFVQNEAFYGCGALEKLELPLDTVRNQIGFLFGSKYFDGAQKVDGFGTFYIPSSLKEVKLTNAKGISVIMQDTFYRCSMLESVTLPEGVRVIGQFTFLGCTSLQQISIPESVDWFVENALADTAWLKNQPNGAVYAGKALYCVKGAIAADTTLVIKEGSVAVAGQALKNNPDRANVVRVIISNSVRMIGDCAFYECAGLRDVEFAANGVLDYIGEKAFFQCPRLANIEIPASVSEIGDGAFAYCAALESLKIGEESALRGIGKHAFYQCENLAEIPFANANQLSRIDISAFDGTAWFKDQADGVVYAGKVLYCYKGTPPENTFVSVKDGTLGISEFAFLNGSGIRGVYIPKSVGYIGGRAFLGCHDIIGIYCEAEIKPQDWDREWNIIGNDKFEAVWGASA